MKYLTSLKNKDLSKEICLLRVDFNINDADLRGSKREFTRNNIHPRILAVLPTIKFLIKRGTKVVILSHRGRPTTIKSSKFKVKNYKQSSLKPFGKILSSLLKKRVNFVNLDALSLINRTKEKIRGSINKTKRI